MVLNLREPPDQAAKNFIRAFVALDLSEEVLEEITQLLSRLKPMISGVKWTALHQWHLTLKFLGSVRPPQVQSIETILSEIAGKAAAFSFRLEGLGLFPDDGKPRVIWVGLGEGRSPVSALALSLESCLSAIGFAAENRSYVPHMTLARVKADLKKPGWVSLLKKEDFSSRHGVRADHLTLYKSSLDASGPIYEVIQKFHFGV